MLVYSDSIEDLETVGCFLVFHEIREHPKKIQNPERLLVVWRQDAQSVSLKPVRAIFYCLGLNKPRAIVFCKYLSKYKVALK